MNQYFKILHISFITAGIVFVTTACTKNPRSSIVIPDQDTAELQYFYAARHRQFDIPPVEAANKKLFYDKQQAKFQKVVTRFPDDTKYTPEAILDISEIMFKSNQYRDMIAYLRKAILIYQNHVDFEPRALFLIGRALDEIQLFQEAKEVYNECINKYGKSKNENIQRIVKECRRYYNRTQTVEKES